MPDLKAPRFMLAPVAGVSDAVFRRLCAQKGCGFAFTEMVSAKALCFSDKRTFELLRAYPGETALGVQLFGSEPDIIAKAIELLPGTFGVIDLNMGCPARKITSNGEGGALMKEPKLAAKIVREAVRAAKAPVTAKIRLGWDENVAADFARRLEDAGAARITLHGRLVSQQYSGHADWDAIAEVKRALGVPLIANGDALDAKSAVALLKHTGCDGVMIARGALGYPWIFSESDALLAGETPDPPTLFERVELAKRHVTAAAGHYGEKRAALIMRKHCAWYLRGVKNSAKARAAINECSAAEELIRVLDSVLESTASG